MKTVQKFLLIASMVATTGFASNAKDELEILEVKGSGPGCRSSSSWDATINKSEKAISFAFQDFYVDSEENKSSSYCDLSIYVQVPAGRTFFTYGADVFGDSDLDASTGAKVTTALSLGSGRSSKSSYRIKKGNQATWETSSKKSGARQAPCGGKRVKIGYRINLELNGNDGVAKVAGKLTKFSRLFYATRPCS